MNHQGLEFITIKGFKSIRSVEALPLRPVNVIIGANGAGKLNFIEVFSLIGEIRQGRLNEYVRRANGANALLYFGSKATSEILLHVAFSCEPNLQYRLQLLPTDDDGLVPGREEAIFWNRAIGGTPHAEALPPQERGREAGISGREFEPAGLFVSVALAGWRPFHVHDTSATSAWRRPAQLEDNDFLRPDGSNLPAFLYLLQQREPQAYELIRRTVQRVAPFFENFNLRPDKLNPNTIRLAWHHKNSDQFFGASALSDGTLRFIALATLLLQPVKYRPSVILVDEPELGLHPYAMTLLASLVKQAAADTQVILSTQSSQLLDHFEPEDVLVAEREAGATCFRRLDSASLASWLESYSLGQLWEKNELGGRPERE